RSSLSVAIGSSTTDMAHPFTPQLDPAADGSAERLKRIRASLGKRHAQERRFRAYGIAAIAAALGFVAILFSMILYQGLPAFTQANLTADVDVDPESVKVADRPVQAPDQSVADYRRAVLDWERKVTMVNWNRVLEKAITAAAAGVDIGSRAAL